MDNENTKVKRTRRSDAARLLPREPRALPPVPSEVPGDEMPLAKTKRKKQKKEVTDVDDTEEPGVEMDQVTGGRQSESQEPLTPEPHEAASQRRKKRKKMQTLDGDGDRPDLANREHHTEGEEVTRKNRKKKKSKMAEAQYDNELHVEDDDIIADDQAPVPHVSLFSAPTGHSQPVSKVFVERNRRFQAADRFDLHRSSDQMENYMEVRPLCTTQHVALKVHSGFRALGLFSHGFLAGYAVWNVVVIYVLAGDQLAALPNMLQQYHALAYPAQSLLYLLLSVSIVSAFDRVNLAKASVALRGFLTLDPAALASLLYFAALILSLSQQMASDRINLYPTSNDTLWPPGSEHQVLQPWIVVNLVIAVLVSLAWIFVSVRHDVDFTEEFLMAMDVDGYIRQEDKPEVVA